MTETASKVAPCWSCKGPVAEGEPFCPTCNAVQPPGQTDHYARLGLDPIFDLDLGELDRKYFERQRMLHPDRFATRTAKEKALSQLQATSLNDAYETLKDPTHRAEYLVHLKGAGVVPEGCHLVNDPSVLMEAMELREALADAESADEVAKVSKRAKADMRECIDNLKSLFEDEDLEGACKMTSRLKYLSKLADETRARRAAIAMMA